MTSGVSSSQVPTSAAPAEVCDQRTDDELMSEARAGVDAAFDLLVRRHQAAVLRVAARYLGDAELAHDVAQTTFVQLFGWLPRYQPRGKFRAFLMRVALRQCAMAARTRSAARRREDAAPVADAGATPAEVALERERRRQLDRALTALSPKLRAVVVLRHCGGMSYDEVAAAMDLPVGTVKSRVFAALAKLRDALEGT
ncbi:MAG: sigma-70 family RNA polymerase sigma factor [Deltaproteobacteria bacterium]|nr:sigma-70 family RNA polymerase sigma factor [Deltaproteobacteria bacterium]